MDNKKTFADLFSSSAVTSDEEKTRVDETQEKSVNSQINQKITFDNLFDQITEENNVQDNASEKKEEINLNSILNFNNVTTSMDNKLQNEEHNLLQNEKENIQPFEKETIYSLENPFFKEEKSVDDKHEEEIDIFKTGDQEEKKNIEADSNSQLANPFFQEENTIQGNQGAENNNSSLEDSRSKEEDNFLSESNSLLSTTSVSQKHQEKNESVSTSPFFESDMLKEGNPLFLDKINLIENERHESKNGIIDTNNSKHFDVKVVKKKEPLFKFILGVLSYAIFIWLLLIGITLLVYVLDIKIRAAKGDYSSPTFNAYVVLTGSMLPDIQVYDVVVTKKVDASDLKEGDIITFASADSRFLNTIITHRIIKKNYDAESKTYTFQTKGDNNNVADSALVPQNNIYGKVILKIPKLGYLQEFLASDGGWIIVILIPCLTVISYDIVKLAKGLKRKKYKNIKVQK